MKAVRQVFYLHGFTSSARSFKAAYFQQRLAPYGVPLHCPDFNEPDFATMTFTRMVGQLAGVLPPIEDGPAALIGSSLGGALAVLAAVKFPEQVDRLVLLAPALMFAKPGHHLLPVERVEEWRRKGAYPFFHHAYGEERLLNFSFYEDSLAFDPFEARFDQPALVFQGLNDQAVDFRTVERFARSRTNITLSLLEDDHQLGASLERIWNDVAPFLGLT